MSSDLTTTLEAAGIDPASLGPFAALVEALDAVVHQRLQDALAERLAEVAPSAYNEDRPSDWDRWFSAEQLAERWQLDKQRVYEIPDFELPFRNIAGTRRKRYHGLDVLRYEGVITQDEYDGFQEARRPGKEAGVLLRPTSEPAGLRQVRGGLDPRHE